MCNFRNYPTQYYWAEGYLRGKGINSTLAGYEYLKIGIVKCIIDDTKSLDDIPTTIEDQASLIVSNRLVKKHTSVEQALIEAIKSIQKYDIEKPTPEPGEEQKEPVGKQIWNFFEEAKKAYRQVG